MVTKHTTVSFTCDICKSAYPSVQEAAACEEGKTPSSHIHDFQLGDEVMLRNRGGRTYTVAKVLSARIGRGGTGHEWFMKLDRFVCLDHKWEESLDEVSAIYLVKDDEAASMERKDNDHGG